MPASLVNYKVSAPFFLSLSKKLGSNRSSTYRSLIIRQEVNDGVIDAHLLFPGLGGKGVVDGDDVDALDALRGEFVSVLGVAGDLGAAGRCEGAWDADNEVCENQQ
jgi:hypothetical protein